MSNSCSILENHITGNKVLLIELSQFWAEKIISSIGKIDVGKDDSEALALSVAMRAALTKIDESE